MTTTEFTRIKCWDDERISRVMNKEALIIDPKAFLATHTPFESIRYIRVPKQIPNTDEQGLLDELIERSAQNLHTFVVVQGIPGTGKSHLVRWLKDRYDIENRRRNSNRDEVLLIERYNSTLRGVLTQIIRSEAFNAEEMNEQMKRLKGAFNKLSKSSLEDDVLDNLRDGTIEAELKEREKAPDWVEDTDIYNFLLDINIRNWFKRKNGPIDRIRRHLAKDNDEQGLKEDEKAGFLPEDFNFDSYTLEKITEGYPIVRMITDHLRDEPVSREALSKYLNSLVGFAITRSVALSADDLKTIFLDLRRNLKKQGKSLALFIEDITAFSGIDTGLVDVLVTQHKGEGEDDFCRILSVIGITDSYFRDYFPTNLQSRMDIHLSLNTRDDTAAESHLLKSNNAMIEMVARYLNAIRLSNGDLEKWYEETNADPEKLINKCVDCPFQETCFNAFGSAEIRPTSSSKIIRIGLYPFNKRAISTMYDWINANKTKTPRTLLSSVIEYVMTNHGWKISEGQFPPPPKDMGSEFSAPNFSDPFTEIHIENQSGLDAGRVKSLLLYWGNRECETVRIEDRTLVGDLPEEVFKAFDIRMISGKAGSYKESVNNGKSAQSTSILKTKEQTKIEEENKDIPDINKDVVRRTHSDDFEKKQRDISQWSNGKNKLQYYVEYAGWIVELLKDSIDWSSYGISPYHAEKRLTYGKIFIEDQAGKEGNHQIVLSKTVEIRNLLIALNWAHTLEIKMGNCEQPSQVGAFISTCTNWVRSIEPTVVDFVQSISEDISASRSLGYTLVVNNLILNLLSGQIVAKKDDVITIYDSLVANAWNKLDWSQFKQQGAIESWIQLRNKFDPKSIDLCRYNFQNVFALNQGKGGIIFLDASSILEIICNFTETWSFENPRSLTDNDDPLWKNELPIYYQLKQDFLPSVQDFKEKLTIELQDLNDYLGGETPEDIFSAMNTVMNKYKDAKRIFNFQIPPYFSSQELYSLLGIVEAISQNTMVSSLIFSFSVHSSKYNLVKSYKAFLKGFYDEMIKEEKSLQDKIDKSPDGFNGATYDRIIKKLEGFAERLKSSIDGLQ